MLILVTSDKTHDPMMCQSCFQDANKIYSCEFYSVTVFAFTDLLKLLFFFKKRLGL